MKNDQLIDQATAGEQRAGAEWEALLGRLQHRAAAEQRLQRVRRAIASGAFHVDARAIAERLIARLLKS